MSFTANNIIYPLQFGFQKDRAIDHVLIDMTEVIRLRLSLHYTVFIQKQYGNVT